MRRTRHFLGFIFVFVISACADDRPLEGVECKASVLIERNHSMEEAWFSLLAYSRTDNTPCDALMTVVFEEDHSGFQPRFVVKLDDVEATMTILTDERLVTEGILETGLATDLAYRRQRWTVPETTANVVEFFIVNWMDKPPGTAYNISVQSGGLPFYPYAL